MNLAQNPLSSLDGIQSFRGLTTLVLSRTCITSLSELYAAQGLKTLIASDCQISDISGLQSLTKLEVLHVDGNRISDITQLSVFASLNRLQRLWIQNNPLCSHPDFKPSLYKYLPQTLKNLNMHSLQIEQQQLFRLSIAVPVEESKNRIPEYLVGPVLQPVQESLQFTPLQSIVEEAPEQIISSELFQEQVQTKRIGEKQDSAEKKLDRIEHLLKMIQGIVLGPENV
ncbi:leucine-rich_repeat domain-containing protein [Hexamita inflata]|uniref:Leucine-rich_repeat domain-containing protein n=1 Tax=Hexamita inflata TaxID=28002 RepID=A0ABP1KQ12_9EUKA